MAAMTTGVVAVAVIAAGAITAVALSGAAKTPAGSNVRDAANVRLTHTGAPKHHDAKHKNRKDDATRHATSKPKVTSPRTPEQPAPAATSAPQPEPSPTPAPQVPTYTVPTYPVQVTYPPQQDCYAPPNPTCTIPPPPAGLTSSPYVSG
jgi:hypothetical protein